MSAQEQVVLTVSVNGYGKRTSSYEYRTTGRGGKGHRRAGAWTHWRAPIACNEAASDLREAHPGAPRQGSHSR